MIKQSMSKKDIKVKRKISIHKGFCPVKRYEIKQRRFDGSWTPFYTREFIAKPYAIGALPYDPKLDRVVLIEQFRIGALETKHTPWLIEIVAGIMDNNLKESSRDLIRREMLEETGLKIEALIPIYNYFSSPGYSTEKLELFCAKVDSKKAQKFCGLKNEHEDIKIHVISSRKAFAAVRSGQINNGAAIIALQWLELNLKSIKRAWK